MKFWAWLTPVLLVALVACNDDDESIAPVSPIAVQDPGILIGEWQIDRYSDEGRNETQYFNGITIVLQEGGQLLLKRNGNTIAEGTWQLRDGNTELDFNIPALANENKSLGEELYELHDDWDITSATTTALKLQDDDEVFELILVE